MFNSGLQLCITVALLMPSYLYAQGTTDLLETKLLISTQELKGTDAFSQRRAFVEFNDENNEANLNEFQNDADLKYVPANITSTFEASNDGSIATSSGLEKLFDGTNPDKKKFLDTIKYLVGNKENWGLSDGVTLAAIKSIFKSYVSIGNPNNPSEIYKKKDSEDPNDPDDFLRQILPKIDEWGGQGPEWVKRLSQATTEALIELNRPSSEILENAEKFTESLVSFISNDGEKKYEPDDVPGMRIGISPVIDRQTPNDEMLFGGESGFDPKNFSAFQQLAVGLTQGFYNSKLQMPKDSEAPTNFDDRPLLSVSDFAEFSDYENSIIQSSSSGLLTALSKVSEEDKQEYSLYTYDSIKSLANGFVLASTVYATSEPEYLAEGLHIEAAERASRGVAHATISHPITDIVYKDKEDPSKEIKAFLASRLAESVSHGSAMGGQLATVLPESMEFVKNWEIFSQSRRDIAQAVARGSSFGAVDAAANKESAKSTDIELIAQGASLGSMVGTTGLAIYYPTDQLVPIINFTAQGSAYGSINSKKLDTLNSPITEEIQVAIARQTAIGSSMGAVFEPSVLLGLRPDTKANDKQTTDNISAATFGATYGAIQGVKDPDLKDVDDGKNSQKPADEISITEIAQSTKQGSTEGALVGAKLALGLDDSSDESLNSKGVILKAINKTNAQAASEASSPLSNLSIASTGTPLVGNPLRTSSKDMLLLMRKYGINPRYTNAATMFKRPVVPQIDEPPTDLIGGDSDYNQSISDASPI